MAKRKLTGIEEMREAVALFNGCVESFNQRFDAEQLLRIYRAYKLSEWDYSPDRWAWYQVERAAEDGAMPRWDDDGKPVPPMMYGFEVRDGDGWSRDLCCRQNSGNMFLYREAAEREIVNTAGCLGVDLSDVRVSEWVPES